MEHSSHEDTQQARLRDFIRGTWLEDMDREEEPEEPESEFEEEEV